MLFGTVLSWLASGARLIRLTSRVTVEAEQVTEQIADVLEAVEDVVAEVSDPAGTTASVPTRN